MNDWWRKHFEYLAPSILDELHLATFALLGCTSTNPHSWGGGEEGSGKTRGAKIGGRGVGVGVVAAVVGVVAAVAGR